MRNITMKHKIGLSGRARRYVSMLTTFALIVGAYLAWQSRDTSVREVAIEIEPTADGVFLIQQSDVEQRLDASPIGSVIGQSTKHLNLSELEDFLEEDPFISSADIYVSFGGRLRVQVYQSTPILRIHDRTGADYYINEHAEVQPLSKHAVVRVPVLTGNVRSFKSALRDSSALPVYQLAMAIQQDPLLQPLIEQISVEGNEYTLIPKLGTGQFLLGDLQDLDKKLDRLDVFIRGVFPQVGWEHYSRVDLRYEGLVFGRKRPGSQMGETAKHFTLSNSKQTL